jgi:hypothetical protein
MFRNICERLKSLRIGFVVREVLSSGTDSGQEDFEWAEPHEF